MLQIYNNVYNNVIAKITIMKMMRDRTSPRYLFDKKYKVSLSTMEDWKVGRTHLPGDGDNWFADGSKNREGTEAGFCGKNSDTSLVVQEEWCKATACNQAKTLMGEHLNPKRAADLRRLSRTEVKTLTEVFIGHQCFQIVDGICPLHFDI